MEALLRSSYGTKFSLGLRKEMLIKDDFSFWGGAPGTQKKYCAIDRRGLPCGMIQGRNYR